MKLNYNIKGTGLSVNDEIRAYVEKRLAHIEKFVRTDSTAHVDVEIEHQTSEDRKRYRTELTLSSGGGVFRAEALGDTLHESIDLAEGEMTREVSRAKKRTVYLARHGAMRAKEVVRGFRKRF